MTTHETHAASPGTPAGSATLPDSLHRLREQVLERDGHHCQACGRRAGDAHPDDAERGVTLDVYHLAVLGLPHEPAPPPAQLQTFCDACAGVRRTHVGRSARPAASPATGHMIEALVLAAPPDVQRRIYEALGATNAI